MRISLIYPNLTSSKIRFFIFHIFTSAALKRIACLCTRSIELSHHGISALSSISLPVSPYQLHFPFSIIDFSSISV